MTVSLPPPDRDNRWHSKFELKKKVWVYVPTQESIAYGTAVKSAIERSWSPPDNYYHLREGGHVAALKSHIKHSYFIRLDIKDFFGCVNKTRVTRSLKTLWGYNLAFEVAKASTVRKPSTPTGSNTLPFGFVQSPLIASLALMQSRLGRRLGELNMQPDLAVSVYMDDIVVSGDDKRALSEIMDELVSVADKSNFPINMSKSEAPSNCITAFNIELSKGKLEITSSRLKAFCDDFYNAENENVKSGLISYVGSVNHAQTSALTSWTP